MFKKKIFKPNVAVHCDTEDKDLALRTYAHSKGYKWYNGDSFLDNPLSYSGAYNYCLLVVNGSFDTLYALKTRNDYKIIPFEKALKKGYEWNEELGKVVFPASEKEEVKEEVRYPIYAKSRVDNTIVKFTAIETGEVVLSSNESNLSVGYVGYTSTSFVSHTAEDIWQILDYNEERGLYDTQPVLCLSDNIRAIRSIRFYDAINDCTFFHNGERDGVIYENKKPLTKEQLIAFKDEIEEMYKNLKV
jgi:hypothetical protein